MPLNPHLRTGADEECRTVATKQLIAATVFLLERPPKEAGVVIDLNPQARVFMMLGSLDLAGSDGSEGISVYLLTAHPTEADRYILLRSYKFGRDEKGMLSFVLLRLASCVGPGALLQYRVKDGRNRSVIRLGKLP